MRTTLDLPEELLERAKAVAAERGVTLPELVSTALAKDVAAGSKPAAATRQRLGFPLFPSRQPGTLELTSADLARTEAEEDRRRHGVPR
ncbi:MAG TPA: hypothetical protein VGE98_02900 [Thermoanaerobaculia bacterium]